MILPYGCLKFSDLCSDIVADGSMISTGSMLILCSKRTRPEILRVKAEIQEVNLPEYVGGMWKQTREKGALSSLNVSEVRIRLSFTLPCRPNEVDTNHSKDDHDHEKTENFKSHFLSPIGMRVNRYLGVTPIRCSCCASRSFGEV